MPNRIKYIRTKTMQKTPIGGDTETDKSLSVQDAAADAKAVGDALDAIASQFTALAPYVQKVKEWIAEEIAEDFDVSSLPEYWQEDTRDALTHTLSLGDDYVHHIAPYNPSGDKFLIALEFTDNDATAEDFGITTDMNEVFRLVDANEMVYDQFSDIPWLDNYFWNSSGLLESEQNSAAINGYLKVTPGKTYKITVNNSNFSTPWMIADLFKTPMQYKNRTGVTGGSNKSITFTIPVGINYITFSAQNLVGYTNDVVFEEVTT